MKNLWWGWLLLLVGCAGAAHEQYRGYRTYRVRAKDGEQRARLQALAPRFPELDVWGLAEAGRALVVMAAPAQQAEFEQALLAEGLTPEVLAEDVQRLLEEEDVVMEQARSSAQRSTRALDYSYYHRYDEIRDYVNSLPALSSRVQVQVVNLTAEGREILAVRITGAGAQATERPLVVVDCGIHAREWVAPPVCTYMLHKLLEDVTEQDLVDDVDWIILPLLNPDGYEFTHTNNRLWRKTRTPDYHATCFGVDGNRNYGFQWMTTGSSSDPCSDVYAGPAAFSEPETQAVRDIILAETSRVALYLSMHSFGAMVLFPYGSDGSTASNGMELHLVGALMANAIDAVSLRDADRYLVGNSAWLLWYLAAGASDDWVHHAGVDLSYTYELPGYEYNTGFEVPPHLIDQVVRETWAGVVAGARHAVWRHHTLRGN